MSVFTLLLVVTMALYRRSLRWPAVPIALTLFYVIALAGAVRFGTGLDYGETALTLALVVSLTSVVTTFNRRETHLLAIGIVVVSSLQLAFAIAETFLHLSAPRGYGTRTGSTFGVNELLPWTGRAPGTFGHAIPLGMFMMVAGLLVIFHMQSWRVSVRVVLASLFIFGIFLSGARSALLSGFLGLVVGLCSKRLTRQFLAWRLTACVGALGFGAFVGIKQLLSSLGLEDTGSLDHRLAALDALNKLTMRSVPELLFGSGAGAVPHLFQLGLLQTDKFTAVDNQLVTLFAVGGIIGTGCVLLAVVAGLRRVPPGIQPALLAMVLMFFSFDEFDRLSTLVLFVTVLACSSLEQRPGTVAGPGPSGPRD